MKCQQKYVKKKIHEISLFYSHVQSNNENEKKSYLKLYFIFDHMQYKE